MIWVMKDGGKAGWREGETVKKKKSRKEAKGEGTDKELKAGRRAKE